MRYSRRPGLGCGHPFSVTLAPERDPSSLVPKNTALMCTYPHTETDTLAHIIKITKSFKGKKNRFILAHGSGVPTSSGCLW